MDNNLFKEDNLYGILARVLGLSQKENGIFVDKDGKSWVLTKYGFRPAIEESFRIANNELRKEIEQLKIGNKDIANETPSLKKQFADVAHHTHLVENENKRLHTLLDGRIAQRIRMVTKLGEFMQKNKHYQNVINSLEKDVMRLRNERNDSDKKNMDLNNELRKNRQENTSLNNGLPELKNKKEPKQNAQDESAKEIERL